MKIHLITFALPPVLDGIGDYTALLAAELAHSAEVTVLTSDENAYDAIASVKIMPVFSIKSGRGVWKIADVVAEDKPDWVVLQYNPFSYGRWGLNLDLAEVMHTLKKRSPQTRFALMAHEMFVPSISWQFALMTTWQRWQLWRLGLAADVIFVSVEAWTRLLQGWFPRKSVIHLPIGSNIPRAVETRAEARAALGIPNETLVLGMFGGAHSSRLFGWIAQAAQAVHQINPNMLVLSLGPAGQDIAHLFSALPFQDEGRLPAGEVARGFAAMDIHLTPFSDGISTRRGSAMAGLVNGVATLSTNGIHTDTIFRQAHENSVVLAPAKQKGCFCNYAVQLAQDKDWRTELGNNGRQLYEQEFTWSILVSKMLSELSGKLICPMVTS